MADGEDAKAPVARAKPRSEEIIDAWFLETIHNSPVSRHTDAFNHVSAAVEDLKARFAKES